MLELLRLRELKPPRRGEAIKELKRTKEARICKARRERRGQDMYVIEER